MSAAVMAKDSAPTADLAEGFNDPERVEQGAVFWQFAGKLSEKNRQRLVNRMAHNVITYDRGNF